MKRLSSDGFLNLGLVREIFLLPLPLYSKPSLSKLIYLEPSLSEHFEGKNSLFPPFSHTFTPVLYSEAAYINPFPHPPASSLLYIYIFAGLLPWFLFQLWVLVRGRSFFVA